MGSSMASGIPKATFEVTKARYQDKGHKRERDALDEFIGK
jgi:hypothetical protein